MKHLYLLTLCVILCALPVQAQLTARQVLDKTMAVLDKDKGYSADMQIKAVGFKFQVSVAVRGEQAFFRTEDGEMYASGSTSYAYDKKKNTVTISNRKKDEKMQMDVSSTFNTGYNVIMEKAEGGYLLRFKKLKGNKTKNAPSSAEMLVNAQNFHPKTVRVKMGIISSTITYSNIKTGIPVQQVTYSLQRYPGATVVDKRN